MLETEFPMVQYNAPLDLSSSSTEVEIAHTTVDIYIERIVTLFLKFRRTII